MQQNTIKKLRTSMVRLTGKRGVDRQKAIIKNNRINIKISKIRIERAKGNINQLLSTQIKQATNYNPKKLEKVLNFLKNDKNEQ